MIQRQIAIVLLLLITVLAPAELLAQQEPLKPEKVLKVRRKRMPFGFRFGAERVVVEKKMEGTRIYSNGENYLVYTADLAGSEDSYVDITFDFNDESALTEASVETYFRDKEASNQLYNKTLKRLERLYGKAEETDDGLSWEFKKRGAVYTAELIKVSIFGDHGFILAYEAQPKG